MIDMIEDISGFIRRHRYILLLAGLVLILCVIPLSVTDITTGHDINYHTGRIWSIGKNIDNGIWFSPIHHAYLDGYGYASPLFYGDVLLHIPGLMVHWGMAPVVALKYFIMMVLTACAFVSYFCGKLVFKNKAAAFAAAAAYTFSSYLCVDMLIRVALGETQAFIFLPILFTGFYNIVFQNGKKWLLLPLGLAGCLISHVLTSVVAVFFLFVFALINTKKFIEDTRKIKLIVLSVVTFAGVSAFFLFPLMEQLVSYDFPITNGKAAVVWGSLSSRAMPGWAILCDFVVKIDPDPWIPNGLGLSPLAGIAGVYYSQYKGWKPGKAAWGLIAAGAVTLLATTNAFPWQSMQGLLGSIQFPWRLLIFATFFFAVAAGFAILKSKSPMFTTVFTVFIVGLSLFSFILTGVDKYFRMYNAADDAVEKMKFMNSFGAGEYMPVYKDDNGNWVDASTIKNYITTQRKDKVTSNHLSAGNIKYTRDFNVLTVKFNNNSEKDTYLEFPLLMYKGYYAEINGIPAEPEYGKSNIVRVYLGDNESGEAVVRYKGTTIQLVSKIVTLVSVAAVILYLIFRKKKTVPVPSLPVEETDGRPEETMPEYNSTPTDSSDGNTP
ncbi:MAG: hypothetical protein GX148_04840 [Clostridiales bacterium]|nr:hypothetical protein [Clostridiales bacterium]